MPTASVWCFPRWPILTTLRSIWHQEAESRGKKPGVEIIRFVNWDPMNNYLTLVLWVYGGVYIEVIHFVLQVNKWGLERISQTLNSIRILFLPLNILPGILCEHITAPCPFPSQAGWLAAPPNSLGSCSFALSSRKLLFLPFSACQNFIRSSKSKILPTYQSPLPLKSSRFFSNHSQMLLRVGNMLALCRALGYRGPAFRKLAIQHRRRGRR